MEKFLTDLFENQKYNPDNFFLMAGPCVVEGSDLVNEVAEKVSGICKRLEIPYIFKASYKKGNRTSGSSFTGIGDEIALKMLKNVGSTFSLPVVSLLVAKPWALRLIKLRMQVMIK